MAADVPFGEAGGVVHGDPDDVTGPCSGEISERGA